jgi:VanZ family protein
MLRLIVFLRPYSRHLLIIWILIITIFSSIPSIPTLKIHTAGKEIRLDYLFHFCEYGFLAFLSYLSFQGRDFKISLQKYLVITIFLIIFAILDEYHQKLIPGRSFNVNDILSNMTGIIAGLLFCIIVFRIVRLR